MKQLSRRGLLLVLLALGANQQAQAHVHYVDITTAGRWDQFSSYGWQQGQIQPGASLTQKALAMTDDVNWYSFTLTQASDITLSLASSPTAGSPGLVAPAFSLYSGLFVEGSFDQNLVIPLDVNQQRGLVNTAQSFSLTTDSPSLAVAQNDLRTINFLASATDGGTGTAVLANLVLGPGSYSVIAAGNNPLNSTEDGTAPYGAAISFAAVPAAVPLPGAFWLMSSALAGLGVFGSRKKSRIAA